VYNLVTTIQGGELMVGKNQIVDAILNGVIKAQKKYNKAASSPLFDAPEYFMDVYIFNELSRITKDDSITLQHKYPETQKNIHTYKRVKRLQKGVKPDITLWYPHEEKRKAFIEVKCLTDDCESDITKICKLINENIKYGLSVSVLYESYCSKLPSSKEEAENNLEQKRKSKEKKVRNIVETQFKNEFTVKPFYGNTRQIETKPDDNKNLWLWIPVCFLLERSKKKA
jgi:hypothetical protein